VVLNSLTAYLKERLPIPDKRDNIDETKKIPDDGLETEQGSRKSF